MRPTLEELKSLWLHAYSRSSLIQADGWVVDLETTDPRTTKYRALISAIIVAYCRPFTKSQVTKSERVVPLADVKPPAELESTHNSLIGLRDKVIGHADALPAKGHDETPNKVLIFRDATGFNLHTVLTSDIAGEERQKIRQLCGHFRTYCDEKLNALIAKFGGDLPSLPGVYEVMITADPEEWFKAVATETWQQMQGKSRCARYRFRRAGLPALTMMIIEFVLGFGLWTARSKRQTDLWYAVRREGSYLYMHCVIKEMIEDHGIPAGMVVDHLDGDGLNNRRDNLEIVTVAENARRWHNRKLTIGFARVT
ncbi:MAG: endonuclease [Verrucomicrobiota bacterium]|jgi:hypothetical protein